MIVTEDSAESFLQHLNHNSFKILKDIFKF
jgi:hypothetical protein